MLMFELEALPLIHFDLQQRTKSNVSIKLNSHTLPPVINPGTLLGPASHISPGDITRINPGDISQINPGDISHIDPGDFTQNTKLNVPVDEDTQASLEDETNQDGIFDTLSRIKFKNHRSK